MFIIGFLCRKVVRIPILLAIGKSVPLLAPSGKLEVHVGKNGARLHLANAKVILNHLNEAKQSGRIAKNHVVFVVSKFFFVVAVLLSSEDIDL